MLRGRGFCYPASPLSLEKPLTLRARQAHSRRVPQLSRFRVHSERRGRVLLCRDAFAYCLARTAYCGTDLVSRADRSRARVPVCWSRVHPKASVVSADDKIFENGVVAGRVSRLGSNHCLSLTRPLLRIGDPSPYAPSPALPSVDPTVLRSCGVSILRSYPLTCATRYQPQHAPEHIVASDTSLAGAQTTPPKTLLSSPHMKDFQKPPICSPFTRIPAPQNIPTSEPRGSGRTGASLRA
jgi:hypothetical protein